MEETNADWWTGKFRGKQGLFPSTYVQKLPQPVETNAPAPAPRAYKPFGAAYQGLSAPPPAGQGVNNVGLQEAPDTEAKKDKYGKYKSTVSPYAYIHLRLLADLVSVGTFRRWRCRFRCR